MAKTSLGKVGILPKGEYSSATQYLRLDIVSYNGSSYLCIKDCVGIDVTNKEYWLLIAQKGDKGDIGEKGEKGDAGKDFSIYKTYASISAMESDASNVPEGEFVLIASNVEDEDNAKLYVKGEESFVYLTDLSGATGIKGEKGEKGDKPVNGVDYNTPEEKEEFKNEVVSTATTEVEQNIETIKEEAIQEFNSNASTKTNEYNDNTTTKLQEYNTNASTKIEEYNSNATQKTNTFNENATTQTETFNNNATSKTNDFNSNASTKTDEFNTNYEEKLESINEASTSVEKERVISDGKYSRALKTPVTDVESTQIYAENDVVDDLVVNGVELTQETREGYNLLSTENLQELNENGITLTKENGIVTINGQSTSANFIDDYFIGNSSNYEEFLTAGTYLISGITGGVLSSDFGIIVVIKHVDESTTTIIQNSENKSFTVREGDTFRIFIRIPQNLQLSNVVIKPMIVAGTEEKPYEEYGASPSIDFPSEVQVVSEQNIQIAKNNLFNISSITNLTSATIRDNIITTLPRNNYGWFKMQNSLFLIKGTVYLSLDIKLESGVANSINRASFNDSLNDAKELTKVGNTSISSDWTRIKFKAELNDNYNLQNIWFQVGEAESAILEIKNIMISYYDVDYEDYYDVNNIKIPLVNSTIGQYTDTIDRENNVQNKIIEKVSFNSNLDWTYNQPGNKFMCSTPAGVQIKNISLPQLCTHYKIKSELASNENEFACTVNGFRFHNDNNMTLEEWKTFLEQQNQAGTPLTVYYIAETPTTIPLSEEVKQELDKFKLYEGLNNVSIDNGTLSFKYNKSLLRAFEEQSELSASLLERIQALEQAQVNQVGGN